MRTMAMAVAAFLISAGGEVASAAEADCRSISDSLRRLNCYDAQSGSPQSPASPGPVPQAAKQPVAEDPLIGKAKAAVKQQLRDPESARFQDVKIRSSQGKKAVCGFLNAKNATGGMTGRHAFAYDGDRAHILATPGPGNGTSRGGDLLALTWEDRVAAVDRLCPRG